METDLDLDPCILILPVSESNSGLDLNPKRPRFECKMKSHKDSDRELGLFLRT